MRSGRATDWNVSTQPDCHILYSAAPGPFPATWPRPTITKPRDKGHLLELHILACSYNVHGGTPEFTALEALFDQAGTTFGSAVREIKFALYLAAGPDVQPLPSLEEGFKNYHENWLPSLPSRTFRRSKGLIEISVRIDFLHAQDLIPETKAEFQARMDRYLYDRQVTVFRLLIAELEAFKKRFKPSDDFDYPKFIDWARSLSARIPKEKSEANELAASLAERRRQRYEQMSPWEKLGVDWEEFHPRARELVPDYRLWSETDDLSPNGNDTGADVLASVQEDASKLESSDDEVRALYRKTWEDWGFSWPPDQQSSDETEYNIHREFVVGLAFACLKVLGHCPAWLRTAATDEIERYQQFLEHRHKDWEHLQEAVAMQALMHSTLLAPQ